jgi:hypothetical protein
MPPLPGPPLPRTVRAKVVPVMDASQSYIATDTETVPQFFSGHYRRGWGFTYLD